jgi:hypothetical protein
MQRDTSRKLRHLLSARWFPRAMQIRRTSCFLVVAAALLRSTLGQGFVNLDFEQASVPPTPIGGYGDSVDPLLVLPGWTVGGNGAFGVLVLYNNRTLGAPAVSVIGPSFPNGTGLNSLQGSYSVLLQYFGNLVGPPTLSQVGAIPADAKSINFLTSSWLSGAQVTLNGVPIPLVPIGGDRLAGDVATFAGLTAQLTFSTTATRGFPQYLFIDDVRFSASPIPEPSGVGLLGIGVLLLSCRALGQAQPNSP